MSMTIEQMRAEVARLYSGDGWRRKVAAMPEGQILAIYNKQVLGKASGQGGTGNAR
ncbi:MAG: hypothetical protein IJC99_04105 [Clostridia bacterium]|nr:hypothetical protein [Clostridia bacterium]